MTFEHLATKIAALMAPALAGCLSIPPPPLAGDDVTTNDAGQLVADDGGVISVQLGTYLISWVPEVGDCPTEIFGAEALTLSPDQTLLYQATGTGCKPYRSTPGTWSEFSPTEYRVEAIALPGCGYDFVENVEAHYLVFSSYDHFSAAITSVRRATADDSIACSSTYTLYGDRQ
jgi:hypothetical protein